MGTLKFRSLRLRLLAPILAASILAAMLVAAMSAWLGTRWATRNVDQRFLGIERALSNSSFPLTASVLGLLAELTDSELITFAESGEVLETTLPLDPHIAPQLEELASHRHARSARGRDRHAIVIGGRPFLAYGYQRSQPSHQADAGRSVMVLFDQAQVDAMRWRAATLPLATGLSTIVVLGALSLYLANRLILRLRRLQRRVEFVANGNFESGDADPIRDEIGLLASAVDSMANQLNDLWRTVQRQQSEKLLHQVSGGMAHQLRNTLTGVRLALELYVRRDHARASEEIDIALRGVEQAEEHIRRLLLVALGQRDRNRRASALDGLRDVQTSLSTIAKHLDVEIHWQLGSDLADMDIKDGPSLVAAVTNLVLNAMQAGTIVSVVCERIASSQLSVSVIDNGPGVSAAIAREIFEPFVTSKPEGLGLGLPLVRRSAEHLEGQVQWRREDEQTVFQLVVRCLEKDLN